MGVCLTSLIPEKSTVKWNFGPFLRRHDACVQIPLVDADQRGDREVSRQVSDAPQIVQATERRFGHDKNQIRAGEALTPEASAHCSVGFRLRAATEP